MYIGLLDRQRPVVLTRSAMSQLSTLPVPAEVFAVVAEHLIGDHAFATAASLNQTSSSIRYQTLPVLYETLIVGEKGVKGYRRLNGGNKPPTGSQYVKWVALYPRVSR